MFRRQRAEPLREFFVGGVTTEQCSSRMLCHPIGIFTPVFFANSDASE